MASYGLAPQLYDFVTCEAQAIVRHAVILIHNARLPDGRVDLEPVPTPMFPGVESLTPLQDEVFTSRSLQYARQAQSGGAGPDDECVDLLHGVHVASLATRSSSGVSILNSRSAAYVHKVLKPTKIHDSMSIDQDAPQQREDFEDLEDLTCERVPSGSRMPFLSLADRTGILRIVPQETRLTFSNDSQHNYVPHLSPDAKHVVYECDGDICVVDVQSKNKFKVVEDVASLAHPKCSPDGDRVVYNAPKDDGRGWDISVVDVQIEAGGVSASQPVRITHAGP